MSVSVNLSQSLIGQLQSQASSLGIPLNELAEKLLSQSLAQLEFSQQLENSSSELEVNGSHEDTASPNNGSEQSALTHLIARIKSMPNNADNIHPPTGTLDDVLAAFETAPSQTPALTAEEWEAQWWPIRNEMREQNRLRRERFQSHDDGLIHNHD